MELIFWILFGWPYQPQTSQSASEIWQAELQYVRENRIPIWSGIYISEDSSCVQTLELYSRGKSFWFKDSASQSSGPVVISKKGTQYFLAFNAADFASAKYAVEGPYLNKVSKDAGHDCRSVRLKKRRIEK